MEISVLPGFLFRNSSLGFIMLLLVGCRPESSLNYNPNPPIDNKRIEQTFDLTRAYNAVDQITQLIYLDANFYFLGKKNNSYVLGATSQEGTLLWINSLDYKANKISQAFSGRDRYLVIAGCKGNQGVIYFYNKSGAIFNTSPMSPIYLSSLNEIVDFAVPSFSQENIMCVGNSKSGPNAIVELQCTGTDSYMLQQPTVFDSSNVNLLATNIFKVSNNNDYCIAYHDNSRTFYRVFNYFTRQTSYFAYSYGVNNNIRYLDSTIYIFSAQNGSVELSFTALYLNRPNYNNTIILPGTFNFHVDDICGIGDTILMCGYTNYAALSPYNNVVGNACILMFDKNLNFLNSYTFGDKSNLSEFSNVCFTGRNHIYWSGYTGKKYVSSLSNDNWYLNQSNSNPWIVKIGLQELLN